MRLSSSGYIQDRHHPADRIILGPQAAQEVGSEFYSVIDTRTCDVTESKASIEWNMVGIFGAAFGVLAGCLTPIKWGRWLCLFGSCGRRTIQVSLSQLPARNRGGF